MSKKTALPSPVKSPEPAPISTPAPPLPPPDPPGKIELALMKSRALPDVPPPCWEPMSRARLFDAKGLPNLDALKDHFKREGLLAEKDALEILNRCAAILRKEPNLMRLNDPITVVGDIHGQFYDLIKLFELGGEPRDQQYLFLGDYVDRGCFGCEVVFFLFAAKIRHPDTFFLLRGNHECRHLTAYFNSKQETKYKYSTAVYDGMMAAFDCLPLAAVLNGRFLCVHGGLSPEVRTLDDISVIHRFREPPSSGAMCDLLWSDPMEEDEEGCAPETMFVHNDLRGCSFVFSFNATCQFLSQNKLLSVIRAHEAQDEGYRLYKKSSTGFPTVICLFSAPNYCDSYDNKAAIIRFQNNLMNIRQFNSSPHPYYLPNFMSAFTWSMPFVAEKVTDMLHTIWSLCEDDGDDEVTKKGSGVIEERGVQLRSKILAMGKMARMFRTLREENENIIKLKGLAGGQLPIGILQQGGDAIQASILGFQSAKKVDSANEKRPALAPETPPK